LYSQAAQTAKTEKQLEKERQALREHQEFVTNNFDKAEQYLTAIQLGGYAAFFAIWSITKDWIEPAQGSFAALLMLFSATIFIFWVVIKSSILTLSLTTHSSIAAQKLETFLQSRMPGLNREAYAVYLLTKTRPIFWFTCTIPALIAIGLLAYQLCLVLLSNL